MQLPEQYRCVYLLGRQTLEVRQLPLPAPGPGEILLRIDAATTCGTDLKVFRLGGHPRMLRAPSPFGHEMAGTVAAVGEDVRSYQPGNRVVVVNSASCGRCAPCLGKRQNLCTDLQYLNGAFADYLLVPRRFVERSTYPLPDDLPADEAALTEPLACVLHGIESCRLAGTVRVLVLGAGPIGQLLAAALASEGHRVTVVDDHDSRRGVAETMGAAATLDRRRAAGQQGIYELAVDATGTLAGWQQALESAQPGGQVLFFGGCPPGSRLELDTGRVHYDELVLRGAYHHRPAAVRRALKLLTQRRFPARRLLTSTATLSETRQALERMARRQDLKVVIRAAADQPALEK